VHESIVEDLLASAEPAIRWKVRAHVLCEPAGSPAMTALREEVRGSAVVRRLLAPFDARARGRAPRRPRPAVYAKWQGAHWVLAALADLGYPPGDEALHPLREQVPRHVAGRGVPPRRRGRHEGGGVPRLRVCR
jgi:hypothetical protein